MEFFLLFIIGLSITLGYILIRQKIALAIPQPSTPITPSSSIITFDIHGVLFTPDWSKIRSLIWANKKVCTLIIYLFNPRFLFRAFILLRKGAVLEKCITALSGDYPYFARYETFIFSVANTQKPIPHMADLIKTLKQEGFTLHIFSNIGTQLYEDLVREFPQEFIMFDKAFTPDGFQGKSHQETFSYYLEEFNPQNKQIVFIDNNRKNVTLAKNVGIISIYYRNPGQLQETLKQLRVI
jgi:FMN phosphatase YigB (HAD superfamily)